MKRKCCDLNRHGFDTNMYAGYSRNNAYEPLGYTGFAK